MDTQTSDTGAQVHRHTDTQKHVQTDTHTYSLAKTDSFVLHKQGLHTASAHLPSMQHRDRPPSLREGSSGHPSLRHPWIQEPQHQGPPGKGRHKPQLLPNTQPGVREEPGPGRACLPTHRRQTPSQRRRQPGLQGSLQNHPGPSGVSYTVPAHPHPHPAPGTSPGPMGTIGLLFKFCFCRAQLCDLHSSALHFSW